MVEREGRESAAQVRQGEGSTPAFRARTGKHDDGDGGCAREALGVRRMRLKVVGAYGMRLFQRALVLRKDSLSKGRRTFRS
jgi:hypothetical protein